MKKSAFELFVESILDDDYSPEGISEWGELKKEHQKEIKVEVIDDKEEYKNWQEYFFDCNESGDFLEKISFAYANDIVSNTYNFPSTAKKEFNKILNDYCKWRVDKIILCYDFPTADDIYFANHDERLIDNLGDE